MIFSHEELRRGTTIMAGASVMEMAGILFYRNPVLGDAVQTPALIGGYAILSRLGQPAWQAV
jgi:hypothetical protein